MIELGLKFTAAYLLGSVLGSVLVGYLRGGVDIRALGSGNPGGTNAWRTQGALFGCGVLIVDMAKGIAAITLLPGLALPDLDPGAAPDRALVLYAVAFAAVLGHVYPLWHDFKGGKGGATAIGILCALEPQIGVAVIVVWLGVVALTGFVGLATMTGAVAAAAWVAIVRLPAEPGLFSFTTLTALLIVYTHRSNIQRMRSGTESRVRLTRSSR